MADDAAAADTRAPAGAAEGGFWGVMLPVLGFLGTGIGIIGFVIFFGGFIVWTRFDAAGLPADGAVAQIPRNDLIVTGASFLVPALLAAVAAVAVAVIGWDALIGNRRRERERDAERRHADAVRWVGTLKARAERLKAQGLKLEREIAARGMAMQQLGQMAVTAATEDRPDVLERLDGAGKQRDGLEQTYARLQERLSRLEEDEIPQALSAELDAKLAIAEAPELTRDERWLAVLVGGVPMLAAQGIVIAAGMGALSFGWFFLLVGIALLTFLVAVVVASNTDHFAWYALCVFVGVGIVIAASTYMRTHNETKVSPVAAIVDREPVVGYFVAETADAVYVARPVLLPGGGLGIDHAAVTLQRLPKRSVTHLTIGPLASELVAFRRSVALATALCHERVARIAAAPAAEGAATARGSRARASSSAGGQASSTAAAEACTKVASKSLATLGRQLGV